tara:strand:- start:32294 stop:34027 length:1734 start_codon:yes stop_codon:yes gene_type:complete
MPLIEFCPIQRWTWGISFFLSLLLFGCETSDDVPAIQAELSRINSIGRELPSDGAALDQQYIRLSMVEPSTLDVGISLFDAQFNAFLFESLLVCDENMEIKGAAAESWSVADDHVTWTFKIRPGALWSDGRPVTAQDFEWSFRRLIDPASGNIFAYFYYPIKGARAYNTGQTTDKNVLGIKAVDERTLIIETEEPCSYFPFILTFFTSVPAPRWQVEKYGRQWTEPEYCVSNSTWQLASWDKNVEMQYVLNPHYNGPWQGYLEQIDFTFVLPGWRGLTAYENNEFDRMGVGGPDYQHARMDPVLKRELITYPNFGTYYTIFQTNKPPFNNVFLRQALAHAIDRESICKVVLGGAATPSYGMLPKGFPGYQVNRIRKYQVFDPELARKRLTEAGYPGGKGLPPLELWVRGQPPTPDEWNVVVAMQQMFQEHLNIKVRLRQQPTNSFNSFMRNHEIPWGFLWFNMDYPDPSDMIAVPWRSQPMGSGRQDWRDNTFDRLVDAAAGEFNNEKRVAIYQDAEEILAKEVAGVFLYNMVNATLSKPWVKGIEENRYGDRRWSGFAPAFSSLYIGETSELNSRR